MVMKKLWISFAIVFTFSFAVLGWIGTRIYQEMPPIPDQIVSTDGTVLLGEGEIGRGQNVWQALAGWKWDRSGGMGATSRRTGRRIGYTVRQRLY
jgi:nitric oxide reductase subunit B